MFCLCSAFAQDDYEVTDTVANTVSHESGNEIPLEPNSMLNMLQGLTTDITPEAPKEQIYPLGKGLFKKHHLVQAIEICPNISKNKISQSDLISDQKPDEVNDTGYGLNFGYSLIFIPGHEKDGQLHLNKAGFAYSTGFVASFSSSDRYGSLCDLMAKIGLETCHNRKIGTGLDFLGGYGKSSGDIFIYKDIVSDSEPEAIIPYTRWIWKYGAQIWLKVGLLGNSSLMSNTDVLLFVRLVKAPYPKDIVRASMFTFNLWKEENWSFGVILRYKM